MFTNHDYEALLRHIRNNENHLELALGITSAREKIIAEAIKYVSEKLEKILGQRDKEPSQWKVCNELSTSPFTAGKQIYLTKTEWQDLYRIALGPDKEHARDFIFGVWYDFDRQMKEVVEHRELIKKCLLDKYNNGESRETWPFFLRIDPFAWDNEKSLTSFLGEKNTEKISNIAGAMLDIAYRTENIIDRIANSFNKNESVLSTDKNR